MRGARGLGCAAVLLAASAAACGHGGGGATSATGEAFVFGQLARAGDAASFRADTRWPRVSDGAGAREHLWLVVVPHELPAGAMRTAAEVREAEARGAAFTIDTMRTVEADRVASLHVGCVLGGGAAC